MWIDEAALGSMPEVEPTRGRPRLYRDALIQALLGLKTVFRLPLDTLQGILDLAFASLPVPNYTTLCRRAQTLEVQLPTVRDDEPINLVVTNTSLKVYGEGEWTDRQHGYSKRRTWRKGQIALDGNTCQMRATLMPHQDVADDDILADARPDSDRRTARYSWRRRCLRLQAVPCRDYHAVRYRVFHRATALFTGMRAFRTPHSAMRQSTRSLESAAEHGRRAAAINVVRSPRTRRISSRHSPAPAQWAQRIDSQATEVAIRVGTLNRMTEFVRTSPSTSPGTIQRHHFVLVPDLCNIANLREILLHWKFQIRPMLSIRRESKKSIDPLQLAGIAPSVEVDRLKWP